MRQGAKAIQVRLDFVGERRGVRADFRIADLRGSRFEARLVNVANASDLETRVGMKGLRMMHSAFAHSDDDNFVGFHKKLSGNIGAFTAGFNDFFEACRVVFKTGIFCS
jgi:hypothetical protein